MLFGVIRQSSGDDPYLDFAKTAIALGGGLDMKLPRRLALRIAPLDYVWQKNPTDGLQAPHGFRYSGGVVFKI